MRIGVVSEMRRTEYQSWTREPSCPLEDMERV